MSKNNENKKSIYAVRRDSLKKLIRKESLDGMVITNLPDVAYLTGFTGDSGALVYCQRKFILVTDSRFTVQVARQCPDLKVHERVGQMAKAVSEVFIGPKGKKTDLKGLNIGVQSPFVSVSEFALYKKFMGTVVKPVGHIADKLRLIKDSSEVSSIRKAAKIAGIAVAETMKWAKPGITEKQMCGYLEYRMMENGADGVGFPTIIAFGGHASECHAEPGNLKLKKGQPFLIDWGARFKGYTSDITRCFCIGKLPKKVEEAYKILLEAQQAAISVIAPGVPLNEPERVIREVLGDFPDAYTHGTGHGIGLNVHELPFMGAKAEGVFKEGMIVTVEPGIYPANKFGLRIEDDVLVTARGHNVLTASVPKSLESVSI